MKRFWEVKFRLYVGQDDDLIGWLSGLDSRLNRSEVIKEALRRGIGESGAEAGVPVQARVDPDAVRNAVTQALNDALGDIRQVVEAAVETALARGGGGRLEPEEEDEGRMLLEQFISGLTLGEEDDEG